MDNTTEKLTFKKVLTTAVNSFFAGVMISIGTMVYMRCTNKVAGAIMFSIGLLTIIRFRFNLYTGVVGYTRKLKEIPYVLTVLAMNIVGCMTMLLVPAMGAQDIIEQKVAILPGYTFVNAMICGLLIYVAVYAKNDLMTVMAVAAFILCGAEHSIADICFLISSRHITIEGVAFVFIVIVGNAIGAILPSLWIERRNS